MLNGQKSRSHGYSALKASCEHEHVTLALALALLVDLEHNLDTIDSRYRKYIPHCHIFTSSSLPFAIFRRYYRHRTHFHVNNVNPDIIPSKLCQFGLVCTRKVCTPLRAHTQRAASASAKHARKRICDIRARGGYTSLSMHVAYNDTGIRRNGQHSQRADCGYINPSLLQLRNREKQTMSPR